MIPVQVLKCCKGEIVAYDLDRQGPTPLRIPNFWKQQNPRCRSAPIVSLAFHPRDLGSLLIGYSEGAVIYSFKLGKPSKFFQYELPPGAQGGDSDPATSKTRRYPRLTQALWHPTGSFVLTGHEDSSLVVWDPKDGRKILARTVQDVHVDQPGVGSRTLGSTSGTFAIKNPLFRIAWCSKENPDDTGILIAGGLATNATDKGLSFLDLGQAPVYATSSWQVLTQYFEKPKKQNTLPTPPNSEVVDFCLIPRKSPYYAGSHDPIAVVTLLSSGELVTLSFPSGHPISPTNQLHPSLLYVHPFVNRIDLSYIDRTRWLGMVENRTKGPPILRGGAEAKHPMLKFANRNIVQAAHADGTIRIWDAGHGDEIENGSALQIDVSKAVGRTSDVNVSRMSASGATGELAVGLRTGELTIFRWGHNKAFGKSVQHVEAKGFGLESIQDRAEPNVKEGLLPLTLFEGQGPVSALKMTDVGFVAAGFETGKIVVIDLRGPAVIYNVGLDDFAPPSRRGSIRKSNSQQSRRPEWPTCIEFGVMSLDNEGKCVFHKALLQRLICVLDYSSILMFVGTSVGHVSTFKLLPETRGGYTVQYAGTTAVDDKVISISPIDADLGDPADASQTAVASLREGVKINGVILVVSNSTARIFKPPAAKGAHKSWDEFLCDSAALVRYQAKGYALLGLFGDGSVKVFSLPGLKQIAAAPISHMLDIRRFSEALITPTGDVLGWTGPSEMVLLNVWGTGTDLCVMSPVVVEYLLTRCSGLGPEISCSMSKLSFLQGRQFPTYNG